MKRNPDATCATCLYGEQFRKAVFDPCPLGGGVSFLDMIKCLRSPTPVEKSTDHSCGEHPEFKRYWTEGE